jgi:hypothetical protein
MTVFKVKLTASWVIDAIDVSDALDHIADRELQPLASDEDNFTTEILTGELSENDKAELVKTFRRRKQILRLPTMRFLQ